MSDLVHKVWLALRTTKRWESNFTPSKADFVYHHESGQFRLSACSANQGDVRATRFDLQGREWSVVFYVTATETVVRLDRRSYLFGEPVVSGNIDLIEKSLVQLMMLG